MLNSLLKITLVAAILRWLKPRYRMLGFTVVLILVVNLAHSEYIEYVSITGRFDYLELSYLLKFLLWILLLVAYYLLVEVRVIVGRSESQLYVAKPRAMDNPEPVGELSGDSDGFDFLRSKGRLESKVDKVIAGKSAEDVSVGAARKTEKS